MIVTSTKLLQSREEIQKKSRGQEERKPSTPAMDYQGKKAESLKSGKGNKKEKRSGISKKQTLKKF